LADGKGNGKGIFNLKKGFCFPKTLEFFFKLREKVRDGKLFCENWPGRDRGWKIAKVGPFSKAKTLDFWKTTRAKHAEQRCLLREKYMVWLNEICAVKSNFGWTFCFSFASISWFTG